MQYLFWFSDFVMNRTFIYLSMFVIFVRVHYKRFALHLVCCNMFCMPGSFWFLYVWFVLKGFYMSESLWQVSVCMVHCGRFQYLLSLSLVFICLVRYNRFLYTWFVNINFYIRVPCSLWQVSICLVRCNRFLHVWFVITGFYLSGSLTQVSGSL